MFEYRKQWKTRLKCAFANPSLALFKYLIVLLSHQFHFVCSTFFSSLPAFFFLSFSVHCFSNMWCIFFSYLRGLFVSIYFDRGSENNVSYIYTDTYCLLNTKIYTDWQSVRQAISFYSNYIAVIQNRNVIEPKWM